MTDWAAAPVFGTRAPGASYVVRPSAYVLLADDAGRLAVVRTPLGLFLPGGGIDPGESPAQAAAREAAEECGLAVRVGGWSAAAVQLAWSPTYHEFYEKRCTFLDAAVAGPPVAAVELDHELLWLPPAEAGPAMRHESHAWAVAEWGARRQFRGP